jgi:hypothetical protein
MGGGGSIREPDDDGRGTRQLRREAGLKGARTKGKERLRQAVLKGHAKRSPEERSETARKVAATRNRNRAAKKNEGQTPGS